MKAARTLLILVAASAFGLAAAQTDHDNIDSERPLSFDDAEPIATGGLALEFGAATRFFRTRAIGFQLPIKFVWGPISDTQFEIGTTGLLGSRFETSGRNFELDVVEFAVLRSFRREIRNSPALALRVDVLAPARRGQSAEYRLTGIASKTATQYDRLHLNVTLDYAARSDAGQNRTRIGAIIGYTRPIGYPRSFDTTGLAELVIGQSRERGGPTSIGIGLGVRRQMSPRSVLDFGVQSGLTGTDRVPLRLIAGYSTSF